jgi:hypothetical protein
MRDVRFFRHVPLWVPHTNLCMSGIAGKLPMQ